MKRGNVLVLRLFAIVQIFYRRPNDTISNSGGARPILALSELRSQKWSNYQGRDFDGQNGRTPFCGVPSLLLQWLNLKVQFATLFQENPPRPPL